MNLGVIASWSPPDRGPHSGQKRPVRYSRYTAAVPEVLRPRTHPCTQCALTPAGISARTAADPDTQNAHQKRLGAPKVNLARGSPRLEAQTQKANFGDKRRSDDPRGANSDPPTYAAPGLRATVLIREFGQLVGSLTRLDFPRGLPA